MSKNEIVQRVLDKIAVLKKKKYVKNNYFEYCSKGKEALEECGVEVAGDCLCWSGEECDG